MAPVTRSDLMPIGSDPIGSDRTLARLAEERDALLEALCDVVDQHCTYDSADGLDSMALSSDADALRLLAKHGRVTILNEHGHRVLARWVKAAPIASDRISRPAPR